MFVDFETFQLEIKTKLLFSPVKEYKSPYKADALTDYGSQSGAESAHIETGNEYKVENHVENGSNGDKHKRVNRVPHTSQYGAYKVVAVDEKQARDTNYGVIMSIAHGVGRGVYPHKKVVAQEKEPHCHNYGAGEKKSKKGTDKL